jgi:hypothetical protein
MFKVENVMAVLTNQLPPVLFMLTHLSNKTLRVNLGMRMFNTQQEEDVLLTNGNMIN